MRRKVIALALCLCLTAACAASAEVTALDQLFITAKDALVLLAQGKQQDALKKLAFDYAQPTDSDEAFVQFLCDFLPDLSADTVQRDVAVCYYEKTSGQYLLAIPTREPKSDDVMCFVLMTSDLQTFNGYAALCWSEVTEGTAHSDWVWWNVEYNAGSNTLYVD